MKAKSNHCEVGDIVRYHCENDHYIDDFDFEVSDIELSDGIIRIFSENMGCMVYEDDFPQYCKVIKTKNTERQKIIDNEELCIAWSDYIEKLERFKNTYNCQPDIVRI